MAIVHRDRQLPDWPAFVLPERWRHWFDVDPEQDGWLRMEEYREGDTLVLRTEVPEIDPDKDVEISVGDGVLTIRAHREMKSGCRSEFHYGELSRSLPLPTGVSGDDVKATYGDGILEVRVPVPAEVAPKSMSVPVQRV
jgi:HSP20 family protein